MYIIWSKCFKKSHNVSRGIAIWKKKPVPFCVISFMSITVNRYIIKTVLKVEYCFDCFQTKWREEV